MALFAWLASRPRPPRKAARFENGMNGLLFSLGPWFFVAMIVAFVGIGVLVGIRAVKHRPPSMIQLVRTKGKG